jgi:hypothetical protein
MQTLATVLVAGVTGALLFVLAAKGTLFAMLLAFFAPLPIMIAALGWGHGSGLAAALVGSGLITLALYAEAGIASAALISIVFAGVIGLPGWFLSRLALLQRNSSLDRPPAWYPLSRLMLWIGALAIALTWVGVLSISTSYASYEGMIDNVAHSFEPILEKMVEATIQLPDGLTVEALARALVEAMPIGSAASTAFLFAANLWLAARIVQASHRLPRPFPSVADELHLPYSLAGALLVAALLAFGDGFVQLFAKIAVAVVAVVFAFSGLAMLHRGTRGRDGRAPILFGAYALIVLFHWPLLIFTVVGLVDCLMPLIRQRGRGRPSA